MLLGLTMPVAASLPDIPNGENIRQVIINGNPQRPSVMQPSGYYNLDTHYLTICFPSTDYCNYTIEISCLYFTQEYCFYTPTAQIDLSLLTNEVVDIAITTEDNDYYWATLDTTDPDEPTE